MSRQERNRRYFLKNAEKIRAHNRARAKERYHKRKAEAEAEANSPATAAWIAWVRSQRTGES